MSINLYGISIPKKSAVCPAQESAAARRGYEAFELRAPAAAEHTDTVAISSQGSLKRDAARISRMVTGEMKRAERADAARVEEIRRSVAEGSYSVSSGCVADAILESALGW